jgi:hypothetical protein
MSKFSGFPFGEMAAAPRKNPGGALAVKLSLTNWAVMAALIVKTEA